jgi:hypothetical protein
VPAVGTAWQLAGYIARVRLVASGTEVGFAGSGFRRNSNRTDREGVGITHDSLPAPLTRIAARRVA